MSADIYENCIDLNPLFVSLTDFHLQNTSPCIGTAVEAVEVNGIWYYAPAVDMEGNPRPNPTDSNPDIGVFEN